MASVQITGVRLPIRGAAVVRMPPCRRARATPRRLPPREAGHKVHGRVSAVKVGQGR